MTLTRNVQMEIGLERGENIFRRNLESGAFSVLVEHDSPGATIAPAAAGEKLAALDAAVREASGDLSMALAVTDGYNFINTHRACEYAGALEAGRRNHHLFYLSGRNTSFVKTKELLSICRASGVANVVPVSGEFMPNSVFTEDVRTLKHIKENFTGEIYPGCVVNPFKYHANVQFSQLFKLVKKFNFGAQFAVTQAGWDMRKLQALKWYLSFRGLEYPLIARLILLTPEKLEKIQSGCCAGIRVSPDFEAILKRELSFSAKQFESAQWRRLELQVAGCKLLGYSAVQISGIDTPERLKLASLRLKSALREFPTFDQWTEEYHNYQARAEMAPEPNSFMMFDKLLHSQHFDPQRSFCRDATGLGGVSPVERAKNHLSRGLFGDGVDALPPHLKLARRVLTGCCGCGNCNLPEVEYVCIRRCPKKLSNGPCGGVKSCGSCEISANECVFMRLTAIAGWRDGLDILEERYISAFDEK